jgi:hypothetical protein
MFSVNRLAIPFVFFVTVLASGCREESARRAAEVDKVGADQSSDNSTASTAWLTDITTEAGLTFHHECGFDGSYHLAETMGPGCALFDFDNDGRLDILLIDGGGPPRMGREVGRITSRLWRQQADGTFVDVTERSGLHNRWYGMGVATGDIDNDGNVDVYLTNYGPDRLFRNNGDGTFSDITESAGIDADGWSVSAAFFDYDGDGWLDLFVVRYVTGADEMRCTDPAGRPDYCSPSSLRAVPDLLFHNGGGACVNVSTRAGISAVAEPGLGVVCADFDGDGRPDVYVANDGRPNHLWLNQGDGTFLESALPLGLAFNAAGQPEASMGIALGDVDRDGRFDLFLTHLRAETNTFYHNQMPLYFEDATYRAGLAAAGLPFTGFGTMFTDLNHDGRLDLVLVNGRVTRHPPLPNGRVPPPFDEFAEPNLLYVGRPGLRFDLDADAGGAFAGTLEISRGLAVGDIDGDGDPDVLVAQCQGPARLYRNDAPKRGHWLIVRAIDPALNRDAIGAKIVVRTGGRAFTGLVHTGGSYASASDVRVHFGLGEVDSIDEIEVIWPDGRQEAFTGTPVNRSVVLRKGTSS